ncbi:MAG: sulfatase-like hydrolase/transferase [Fuerstiella sp.]
MKQNISTYRVLLAAALAVVTLPQTGQAEQKRPNIVFILADDMGYGDLKAFNPNSRIPTPHLDELAKDGMCFTDAHSGGSTCKPSRYALITGRFAARKDSFNDRIPIIVDGRVTVASVLRDNGYQTAMVGKWHLGFDRKSGKQGKGSKGDDFDYEQPLIGGPVDRGFDSFFGMHASLDIQPFFYIKDRAATMPVTDTVNASTSVGGEEGWNRIQGAFWRSGNVAPDFKHAEVTPRFADEACKVIESHDGKKPLFLYLALPSPHTPWLPAKEFIGKSGAGMYGDFVMTVDSVVCQVQASLDKAGLSENTMVMFSSDNGPVWYEKDVEKFGHQSVGPLRGVKGSAWEGGHRVPFIAKWPGHIKAGVKNDRTIAFADVLATLAEVAGQKKLKSGTAEDSESFLSTLLHPEQKQEPRSPILHGGKVIRDGDWKLINTKGSRGFGADRKRQYGIELYNLRDDLSEKNNLAKEMPEKVEGLKVKIGQILNDSTTASSVEDSTWRELFNGRDLSGWEANARPEAFTVEDGLLKAHGRNGMSHLFYVGDTGRDVAFKNFELVAVARSQSNSNSGIFFHTGRELRKGKYLNKGYELQLNSSEKEKRKTGSLYGVVDLDTSPADETKWFEIRMRVEGKRIQVFVEGERVVDYTEPPEPVRQPSRSMRLVDPQGGAVAIQAHDPNSVFYFKQIRVRELQ